MSSLERWLLVAKYKEPWFVWSGGFIWTGSRWELSDTFSGDFGKYTKSNNWLSRELNSRTQEINGNINYKKILNIGLTVDVSNNPYQTEDNKINNFFRSSYNISGVFYKENQFNNIVQDTGISIKRKILVYDDDDEYIKPGINTTTNWNAIFNENINNQSTIFFKEGTYNIHDQYAIIWSWFCTNLTCYTWDLSEEIWAWWYHTGIVFYITWDIKDESDQRLPNLKYYFESNTWFADIYYYIDWQWTIWKYQQNLSIKKPTSNIKNPNRKNFIFPYYE